jgi:hypothetical protein
VSLQFQHPIPNGRTSDHGLVNSTRTNNSFDPFVLRNVDSSHFITTHKVTTTKLMSSDAPQGFEDRLRQRASAMNPNTLETIPVNHHPHENIPNTPLAASAISFLLGCIFSLGLMLFLMGGISERWWATYQLGFFLAAWSGFHWGEFAVTAGWNRSKCSVDCLSVSVVPREIH